MYHPGIWLEGLRKTRHPVRFSGIVLKDMSYSVLLTGLLPQNTTQNLRNRTFQCNLKEQSPSSEARCFLYCKEITRILWKANFH